MRLEIDNNILHPSRLGRLLPRRAKPNAAADEKLQSVAKVRAKYLLVLAIYVPCFLWVYETWGSPNWWYLGLAADGTRWEITFGILVAVASVFVLPTQIKKYSHYFITLLYWASILPTYLVIARQGYKGVNSFEINGYMFVALILIAKIPDLVDLGHAKKRFHLAEKRMIVSVTSVYVMLLGLFYYNYSDILSFAGIETIYDQRSAFAQVQVNIFLLYVLGWLSTTLNPYFITYGMIDKTKRWMMWLGLAGQILIYMGFASKGFLLILFIYFWFYLVVLKSGRLRPERISYVYLAFAVISVVSAYLSASDYDPQNTGFGFWTVIASVVYMRALGLPAALTGVYAAYFATNPLTYFSQMNIMNLFVQYPYTEVLGMVIGRFLAGGSTGMNANASMWATDGLASIGPIGIIFVGTVVGVALIFANRIVTPDKLVFASIFSTTFVMNLGDSGFFTNMITGGGFLMVLAVAFASPVLGQKTKTSATGLHVRTVGN